MRRSGWSIWGEYRKIKWPFPPTTSPPHAGVGPYAPRQRRASAGGRRPARTGPESKRGESAVAEKEAGRTAQPWGQAAKHSRATCNVVSLLSQRVETAGHFRPASSLDGEVMLVKFFHASDCLAYDKTRGTLPGRPGARGPQVFRY